MRTTLVKLLLLGCLVFVGCSQSGDFTSFIIAEVAKYGGHIKTGGAIPKLDAKWTIKRDDHGFILSVTGASFKNIAADMEQVFGPPKFSDDGSGMASHEPGREWSAVDIGVAIQLVVHKDRTEIICIRGMKDMGELFRHMSSLSGGKP